MTKLKADPDRTGLDHLDVTTHPARDAAGFRRIIAALDTTRQAAQQRFGA